MIIAVDIGNTNIVLGLIEKGQILERLRLSTDRKKTWQEYYFLLRDFLRYARDRGLSLPEEEWPRLLEGSIVSSVVPSLRKIFGQALEALTQKRCLIVGPGLKTGLNIKTDQPASLGSDLVVDAVAALHKYQPPLAIFDLGTATTLSVIDPSGQYIGGCICAGLRIGTDALSSGTSSLPYIDLEEPGRVIGKNTVECMRAGAIYGHAAMMDGLLERVEAELGSEVTALATGGLVPCVLPHCKKKIEECPDLLLEGLYCLYERNKPGT